MKRMLFTVPDHVANILQEVVPEGERSKFVVKHITMPLRKLQEKKKNKPKKTADDIYQARFLREIKEARAQIKRGEVYTEEEVMKRLGIL